MSTAKYWKPSSLSTNIATTDIFGETKLNGQERITANCYTVFTRVNCNKLTTQATAQRSDMHDNGHSAAAEDIQLEGNALRSGLIAVEYCIPYN